MIRIGTPGADILSGTPDADELWGLAGADALSGRGGSDLLDGGENNDTLNGGSGVDYIYGGKGDDTALIARTGDTDDGEIYDGGAGWDTILGDSSATVTFAQGAVFHRWEVLSGFEALTLTPAQLQSFTSQINTADITLGSGGTVDLTNVEVLTHTFSLSDFGNGLVVSSGRVINGGSGSDTVTVTGNLGNVLFGAGGDDVITGASNGDAIEGGAGDDVLSGGAGNDQLNGGAGVDSVSGGDGDDVFFVTGPNEVAKGEMHDGGAGHDIIDGGGTNTSVIFGASAVFVGWEDLTGFGSLSLTPSQLSSFTGLISAGRITLSSGGLVDLTGSEIRTEEFFLSNKGNHFILDDAAFVHGGRAADQVEMVGPGELHAYGNNGDDVLIAADGPVNELDGGEGNDTLIGGSGGNQMHGGNGSDATVAGAGDGLDIVYYYNAPESTGKAFDTVVGFDMAQDRFALWTNGVAEVQAPVTFGNLSSESFNKDMAKALKNYLEPGNVVLFTPSAGDFASQTFMIINNHGGFGYQSGSDLVVRLQDYSGTLSTTSFWPL